MDRYEENVLNRWYLKGSKNVRGPASWEFLKRGTIKNGTEGLLTAVQDQVQTLKQQIIRASTHWKLRKKIWATMQGNVVRLFTRQCLGK